MSVLCNSHGALHLASMGKGSGRRSQTNTHRPRTIICSDPSVVHLFSTEVLFLEHINALAAHFTIGHANKAYLNRIDTDTQRERERDRGRKRNKQIEKETDKKGENERESERKSVYDCSFVSDSRNFPSDVSLHSINITYKSFIK